MFDTLADQEQRMANLEQRVKRLEDRILAYHDALTADPEMVEQSAQLLRLIREIPGLSQRSVCTLAKERHGISRARTIDLLRRENGVLWHRIEGAGASLMYFSGSVPCTHGTEQSVIELSPAQRTAGDPYPEVSEV